MTPQKLKNHQKRGDNSLKLKKNPFRGLQNSSARLSALRILKWLLIIIFCNFYNDLQLVHWNSIICWCFNSFWLTYTQVLSICTGFRDFNQGKYCNPMRKRLCCAFETVISYVPKLQLVDIFCVDRVTSSVSRSIESFISAVCDKCCMTFSDGMLMYNGQASTGNGDFVSLNLVKGRIQVRNLHHSRNTTLNMPGKTVLCNKSIFLKVS